MEKERHTQFHSRYHISYYDIQELVPSDKKITFHPNSTSPDIAQIMLLMM